MKPAGFMLRGSIWSKRRSVGSLTLARRDIHELFPEDVEELWQPMWWIDDLDLPDHTWTCIGPYPLRLNELAEIDRRPGAIRYQCVTTKWPKRLGAHVWMQGPFGHRVQVQRNHADWRYFLRHGYKEEPMTSTKEETYATPT